MVCPCAHEREKLTGCDYMTRPYLELSSHPDFSPHAHRLISAISEMSTEQIENLDITGVMK